MLSLALVGKANKLLLSLAPYSSSYSVCKKCSLLIVVIFYLLAAHLSAVQCQTTANSVLFTSILKKPLELIAGVNPLTLMTASQLGELLIANHRNKKLPPKPSDKDDHPDVEYIENDTTNTGNKAFEPYP